MKLSESQKELLGLATAKYAENIYQAEDYLKNRGITLDVARLARLGVVTEPEPGHEAFIGRLAIPYITKSGVVDIRFRALNPAVEPKYMGMAGTDTKLYNVLDIERAGDWIGICEGELDTLTMSRCIGVPCVGVPGVNNWKKHYTRLLSDFDKVFLFADGDNAGSEFGKSLSRELSNLIVVHMPDGEDVNSIYRTHGAEFFKEKIAGAQ